MSDTEKLSNPHRKEIEDKIVGKRLKAICWFNRPDFDDEILALEFEDKATLRLYATDWGNIIWGEVRDT